MNKPEWLLEIEKFNELSKVNGPALHENGGVFKDRDTLLSALNKAYEALEETKKLINSGQTMLHKGDIHTQVYFHRRDIQRIIDGYSFNPLEVK